MAFVKPGKGIDFSRLLDPDYVPEARIPRVVDGFEGYYEYLSNFYHWSDWDGEASYDGMRYRTAEHAFAAAKTLDPVRRELIADISKANDAKREGRSVTLRPEWDSRVRFEAMYEIVRSKFSNTGGLGSLLLQTEDDLLVERTSHKMKDGTRRFWHDQTWGWCDCAQHRSWPGQNHLGRILMRVRSELRSEPAERWAKVMATGHRPQHMSVDQQAWAADQLDRVAAKLIAEHGMRIAIHGGAIGADLEWARAADDAGVDALWAHLPFPQQPDKWSQDQRAQWTRYTTLRERGSEEPTGGRATWAQYLADDFDVKYLHARNDWMIRDSDAVVAVVDPGKTTGGTASALAKVGTSKPVIRLNIVNRTVKIARPAVAA